MSRKRISKQEFHTQHRVQVLSPSQGLAGAIRRALGIYTPAIVRNAGRIMFI